MFFSLLTTALFSNTAEAIPVNLLSVGDLVVSEVMHTPSGVADYRGEWIEIYNNAGIEVNFNGLVVSDGSQSTTISSDVNVAAGDYFIMSTRQLSQNGGATTDYTYSNGQLRLSNTEQVSLIVGTTTIDTFDWDNGGSYPVASGSSLSLDPGSLNSTDNDTSTNWCLAASSFGGVGMYGTPGSANDNCQSGLASINVGDIVISEVMHKPTKTSYYRGEWIELYNASSDYIDVNGLQVTCGTEAGFTINESVSIRPGEYALLANRRNPLYNGGISSTDVDFTYSYGVCKHFPTDTISITDGATTIDTFTWDSSYISNDGRSLSLDPDELTASDNDTAGNWCEASSTYGDGDYGTPRTANDQCSTSDGDGDGQTVAQGDCDDTDADIFTGNTETCDGKDNDCSGTADDNNPSGGTTYYADADGDGFGNSSSTIVACSVPSGYVTDISQPDCDDTRSTVNPSGTETCNGLDNDCDGTPDNNATDGVSYYADTDGDGYGDSGDSATISCSAISGEVTNNQDCNDGDISINPGATETCLDTEDKDCDGSFGGVDSDGDTFTACQECNDSDEDIFPGATEVCDGFDNDCDGDIDEAGATGGNTYYLDSDGDGFGDSANPTTACSLPLGYVANSTDCDDGDAAQYPGAPETCNSEDDDCDGTTDEAGASGGTTVYADTDGDGFGDASSTSSACSSNVPSGFVTDNTDCNDSDIAINPGATEVCDSGVDNNCDGAADDADTDDLDNATTNTYYLDGDNDLYGSNDSADTTQACALPSGYRSSNTDCNDGNTSIRPSAKEICDTIDNNCSGSIDGADVNLYEVRYPDLDGDGFGDATAGTESCDVTFILDTSPASTSGTPVGGADCNDDPSNNGSAVFPGAADNTCDGIDNDCDGTADEDAGGAQTTYFRDADNDTYGIANETIQSCGGAPTGYTTISGDCNDDPLNGGAAVNPGATEVCDANNVDEDCDGLADDLDPDGNATGAVSYYQDTDGDFYGDDSTVVSQCDSPGSGYRINGGDCNEGDASVNPGATDDSCDNVDNDCDGSTDEGATFENYYVDSDGDLFGDLSDLSPTSSCSPVSGEVTNNTDCNDGNININPNGTETCNGLDDDCDGTADDGVSADSYYTDSDGDGYGDASDVTPTSSCTPVGGEASNNTDCNDGNSAINPGATEVCFDNVDQDCDGSNSDNLGVCESDASSADQIIAGGSGDILGWGSDAIGDFNGDGIADFITSSRGDTTAGADTGTAYVFFGPITGSESISNADLVITGATNDRLGYAVAGGQLAPSGDSRFQAVSGNVDGTGGDDLLLGAPFNDGVANNAGIAYLFFSRGAGTVSVSSADVTFTGERDGAYFGWGTALADVTGDNNADVIVSAPRHYEWGGGWEAGRVYIFNGSSSLTGTVSGEDADTIVYKARKRDRMGISVAALNVRGTGVADLIVGAYRRDRYTAATFPGGSCDPQEADCDPSGEGQVLIFAGGSFGTRVDVEAGAADAYYVGENDEDEIGEWVRGAGDINNDGSQDILISSSRYTGQNRRGVLYIVRGDISGEQILSTGNSNVIARIVGNSVGDQLGRSSARIGDINGDGSDDIIVGARSLDVNGVDSGGAYIFMGPISGQLNASDADVIIDGSSAGDQFGEIVTAGGDIDNDGSMDILINAGSRNSGSGAVYIFEGSHF